MANLDFLLSYVPVHMLISSGKSFSSAPKERLRSIWSQCPEAVEETAGGNQVNRLCDLSKTSNLEHISTEETVLPFYLSHSTICVTLVLISINWQVF